MTKSQKKETNSCKLLKEKSHESESHKCRLFNTQKYVKYFQLLKAQLPGKSFRFMHSALDKKFEQFEISFRSIRLRAATGSIDAVTHAQFNFELHFTDIFICCMSKPYPMEFNGKRETKEFSSGVSPNQISLQNSALNRKVVEELSGCSGDSMELSCFCFKMQQQMIRS